MGAVYRARDLQSGASVAVKLILDYVPQPSDAQDRFDHEARALAGLSHPHVVRYITQGVTRDGEPYLVMEWLEGEDLAARLARGPLPVDEALELARGVASALGAAHARGIVHRDIKPKNLFLVGGSIARVKVVDFGIARIATATRRLTRSGLVLGTPGYMAPEQARGDGQPVDARADVFSLGTVLFECLTGRPLFQASHIMALLAKLLLEEAPRLAEFLPDAPAALDALVARMLAKDPADRPEDGSALAHAIASLGPGGGEERSPSPASSATALEGLTDVEQRLVSVVAALPYVESAPVDPDAATLAQGLSTENFLSVRRELSALGARVDELANGAIVVTLMGAGEPIDRAARAARCALRLRALVSEMPVALATGRAEEASGRLPVGEVVERVTLLLEDEQKRPDRPDGVRIDELTHTLLDARFDVVESGGRASLRGPREAEDAARTLLGKPSPFLGRELELRMLRALVDESFEEPSARAALLIGAAGMGKSRLLHEVVSRLREERPHALVAIGRGESFGEGSAFSLLGSALRSAMSGAPGEGRERLTTFVQEYVDPSERERVAEFVGEMLGLPLPDEGNPRLKAARGSPPIMADRIREAFVDLASAVVKKRPLVLVLEDLHWGDAASVRLVDAALGALRDQPFTVLAVGRPEALDLFPRIFAERNLQSLRLHDLPRKACERLVRHALGDAGEAAVKEIVERAAGNAFFLEEIVRAVSDGRGGSLPETVLGTVEARLSALDAPARRTLRAASIFGVSFWTNSVLSLLGDEEDAGAVAATLGALVEREIVVPRRESRFAGEREYAFRHVLLREGAYAMLTERDRALGHRLAGAWLASRNEPDPKILAEHFERGGEAASAAHFYGRAAEHALSAGDDEATIALAERALGLGAGGDEAAGLYAILTDAWNWSGDHARAYAAAERALERATPGSKSYCRALGGAISTALLAGKPEARPDLLRELLRVEPEDDAIPALVWAFSVAIMPHLHAAQREAAERHLARMEEIAAPVLERDPEVSAWVKMTRAFHVRYVQRDPFAALALDQAALVHLAVAGDRRYGPYVEMHVGVDWTLLGALETAEAALARAIAAGEPGSTTSQAARIYLGRTLLQGGRIDEAERMVTAVVEEARDERLAGLNARLALAEVRLSKGDLAGVGPALDALVPGAKDLPFARMSLGALRASLRLAEGRADEALATAEEAIAESEQLGMYPLNHEQLLVTRAEALLALGRADEARAVSDAARADLLARAQRIGDEALRKSFLERVPSHARILALSANLTGSSET